MLLLLIFATIAACAADVTAPPPIRCGEMPNTILGCVGIPRLLSEDASRGCPKATTECETLTCVFRNTGWLNAGKIDKQKVIAHFNQFAKDHPVWSAAVEHMKANCLAYDLPAQGVELNCPAYDIMICSLSSFIKNVQPSQWSSAPQCQYARQFAAACPVCPGECFAPLVPYRSCNACLALPRSP